MADNPDILGGPPVNAAVNPRFIVKVNGDDWSDFFLHGHINLLGDNRNAVFDLAMEYSSAGNIPIGGTLDAGSKAASLLQEHTDVHRDVVEVYGGYPSDPNQYTTSDLTLLVDGVVDEVRVGLKKDVIEIKGRDKSAIFKESFIHRQFRNKTVAGAVKEIADDHGMQSDIVDAGSKLGIVYGQEQINIENIPSSGLNDWELLTRFADYDTYAVYVTGNTLHYRPIEQADQYIFFEWLNNIQELEGRKNLSMTSSRITIELCSTRLKQKDSTLVSVGPGRVPGVGRGDAVVLRYYDVPSRDPETLGYIAESLALIMGSREKIVTVNALGSGVQTFNNGMKIKKTGTPFDDTYRMISIDWKFGYEQGWYAEITGIKLPDNAFLKTHRQRGRHLITKA